MNTYGYSVWKEKPTSRPALIITNDGGNKYQKVAVFRNEESVQMFDDWLQNVLREYTDTLFKTVATDIDSRLARMIGGAEDD